MARCRHVFVPGDDGYRTDFEVCVYCGECRQSGEESAGLGPALVMAEGWGEIRPGDRRAHYYRRGFSLCGRVGFYRGPLEEAGAYSPDDCKACWAKLSRTALRGVEDPGKAR